MTILNEILSTVKEDVELIIENINWNPSGLNPEDCVPLIEIKSMFIRINEKIDALNLQKQEKRPTLANTKGEVNE